MLTHLVVGAAYRANGSELVTGAHDREQLIEKKS
jgi:hypothetical protein